MTVASDIMSRDLITVDSQQTILKSLDIMRKKSISCLIVIKDSKTVGIVTERDIITRAIPKKLNLGKEKITKIMSKPLITCETDCDLAKISTTMEDNNIRRVVIVKDNRPVGIITQTDIIDQTKRLFIQNKKIIFHQNVQTFLIFVCIALTAFIIYQIFR